MKIQKIGKVISAALLMIAAGCVKKPDPVMPSASPSAVPEMVQTAEPEAVNTPESAAEEEAGISYAEFVSENEAVAGSQTHEVFILPLNMEGRSVYGRLYLPRLTEEKCPLVIMCHGFQGNYEDVSGYTGYFVDAGIAVYIFDFCGGSTYSSSSGDFLHMSAVTEKEDLGAVMDELCGEYAFLDDDHVFLMGESQGGLAAALLAAERADDVAGLILFYPAFSIPDMGREMYGGGLPEVPYAFNVPVGQQYYTDVMDMDVWTEIAGYTGPVRIYHGSADVIVPVSYSEKAEEVYENARVSVYPGEGHGFSDGLLPDICSEARDFVLTECGS